MGSARKQLEAVRELQARRAARQSLVRYCAYTHPNYQANWHHETISDFFEKIVTGEIDRLMIKTPPRHGKSEEVTVRGNAYYLGRNPDHSIIGTSYAAPLATTFSRATRNIIGSPLHQRLWTSEFKTEADTSWQLTTRLDERPSYIAAGAGGPISGQGANLLNIDDPIKNAEEADSEIQRESLWNWYTSTARTRLLTGGRIVMTYTSWHENDLGGRLLRQALADKKADQWTVLVLPATNDNGDEAYWYSTRSPKQKHYFKPYDALWPDAYNREELDRIRASMPIRWWNALYQQNPTALAGGIILRDWFKRYRLAELPNKWDRIVQSWDMSFKDTKTSAYVAGQVWGRWRTRRYLLAQKRENAGFAKSCKMVRQLTEEWPAAQLKLIEDKANGPAIMEALQDEIGGFVPIEPQGSKPARLEAASVSYMGGDVYHPLPEEAPWIISVEDELCVAPNGTYWDQADCVSQFLNWERMTAVGKIDYLPSQTRQAHAYLGGY